MNEIMKTKIEKTISLTEIDKNENCKTKTFVCLENYH